MSTCASYDIREVKKRSYFISTPNLNVDLQNEISEANLSHRIGCRHIYL